MSAFRSNSAEKEKLAGLRENKVSGDPVPLSSGLVDAKLMVGTRGMVKTSTSATLDRLSARRI